MTDPAGFAVFGGIGNVDREHVRRAARTLGLEAAALDDTGAVLYAGAGRVSRWTAPDGSRSGVVWSTARLPDHARAARWQDVARTLDACGIEVGRDGSRLIHSGISGTVPLYLQLEADAAYVSSSIAALASRVGAPLRPDWDAWACVLAVGAPLAGRTPFVGVRRLGPWSTVEWSAGRAPAVRQPSWPWLEVEAAGNATLADVADALRHAVMTAVAPATPVDVLLSGGWDSRILACLAVQSVRAADGVRAWTTSSDIGTSLEELVARKVALQLGMAHTIATPRHDAFAADVEAFAASVEYQSSFHVWLMPLARRLRGRPGPILDGLGGGIVLGGAFADRRTTDPADDEARFDRLARYLDQADEVLRPEIAVAVRDRARADFAKAVERIAGHPRPALFTAFLTRTMPAIALGPRATLAAGAPVATPFLDDRVVSAALTLPETVTRDGRAYRELLALIDPRAAATPTAAELTIRRSHARRGASPVAAAYFRQLLREPGPDALLTPALRDADLAAWQRLLGRTRSQHLIRGLAVLALWLEHHADELTDPDPTALIG